jgi:hypothetical protein
MTPSNFLHALTGAIVAVAVCGVSLAFYGPKQITHSVYASKHAWPDLSEAEKAELASRLKPIAGKLDIVCGDAGCSDLAADIDDAAEKAGVESVLDRPIGPLGYGLGVRADKGDDRAQRVADALKAATGGRLRPVVGTIEPQNMPLPGYAQIFIGKNRD